MKSRPLLNPWLAAALLGAPLAWLDVHAAGLGHGFSYQGRLLEGGLPAQGRYDLRFELFSAGAGGTPWAAPLTNRAVNVEAGVFNVLLDFGTNVFSGASCWLEIGVRPSGPPVEFVVLAPRQPLTPVPYAIYTLQAESVVGPLSAAQLPTNVARLDLDQTFGGSVTFGGLVTIGTSNAPGLLDVRGGVRGTFSGDGGALSNVTAVGLGARAMERLWRVPLTFVAVTNAGNAADSNGKGAVAYPFRMGKFEVNNNQYATFLNAVAVEDPHALYDTNMSLSAHGGIERSGVPGDFAYTVKPGFGHRPVVWVDFYDTLRFCNWLHNGQPAGKQDETTTEDGAYSLTPEALAAENVLRNAQARFWLPSDDEWYKAAYHQPFADGGEPSGYWLYPTRSNDVPLSEPPPGGITSVNACCDAGGHATDVGSYAEASTWYGTFDQAGNVQEWTEWTSEFAFLRNRRVRGGSWEYNEFYSSSQDFEFDTTDYPAPGLGFRVAGPLDR
jgi:formylglycine-generating enzyme required for sulfatase activity